MRLLNVKSLELAEYHNAEDKPRYVIASHRWISGSEATFQDVLERLNTETPGYKKIEGFAQYVRSSIPSVEWLWIDTCCINRHSAAELSEAINLMFEWYRNAEVCLAYLADVTAAQDKSSFERSEWFRRGWTLQELLAPRTVVFLTEQWQVIGNKGGSAQSYNRSLIGPGLEREVARITGLPEQVLHDYPMSFGLSIEERLKWMESRATTREEDMSYALYGIFNVSLGANYGERGRGARQRLLAAIYRLENLAAEQADGFQKLVNWLAPPDPWTDHMAARQRHEPNTGAWLLHSDQYRAWKFGSIQNLWVSGKAGCGKTVLCSTAIEDIRTYCMTAANVGQIVFYFSFSDNSKQTYKNLLHSLVIQLGRTEPGLSLLFQAYHRLGQKLPELEELEKILLACIASYDVVFLHLDALDECVEGDDVQLSVLVRIEHLLQNAPKLRMLATSREVSNIRNCMSMLGAETISIRASAMNLDIQKYVSTELSREWKLSRLGFATRELIKETLAQKADGMFRWAYFQLQELKKLKSTRPSAVRAALLALPATLDETYERMLSGIHERDRSDALTLLRWITYARTPLSLSELAEATIVNPANYLAMDGAVDTENRGGWEDALSILAGLITVVDTDESDSDNEVAIPDASVKRKNVFSIAHSGQWIEKDAKIRLAHFSVKEYLESARITESDAKDFHLDPIQEHRFLAQSCLVYLRHYSGSPQKSASSEDVVAFPLLQYAARSWYYHSALQQYGSNRRELSLLTSENSKHDWLLVHQPDQAWEQSFKHIYNVGSGLYYASFVGLKELVRALLESGAEVNAQGGHYGNALQAAAKGGHAEVVELLLETGAEVNAQGGHYGNALQAAVDGGHAEIVELLLETGAEINAQGGLYGNALQAAAKGGHAEIVKLLLETGAEVNAPGGHHGNALQAAAYEGRTDTVKLLLNAGADVNAKGGEYDNARQAALLQGHAFIAKLLLEVEAIDKHAKEQAEDSDSPDSVMSNKSMHSTFSSASTTSSASSTTTVLAPGIEIFVESSSEREDFVSLIINAIARMSRERFIRNNARLLKGLYQKAHEVSVTQAERRAAWVLRRKARRVEISRRLYAYYCADDTFDKAKLQSKQPMQERIPKLLDTAAVPTSSLSLRHQVETPGSEREFGSAGDNGEALGTSETIHVGDESGSERSSDSTESSDDERQGRRAMFKELREFVLSSDAFQSYVNDLRIFLHPVTPQLLLETAKQGDIKHVKRLLNNSFDIVAQDQLHWLHNLVELGQSKAEIAEMLVDVETHTPWIFFQFQIEQQHQLLPNFHQDGCIHEAAASIAKSNPIEVNDFALLQYDHSMDLRAQLELKKRISSLCGLAGIVPSSRDMRDWNGMVSFTHDRDVTTAAVSYGLQDKAQNDNISMIYRLLRVIEGLENAMGLLQESGISCDAFTILCWRAAQVELCKIRAASVLDLAKALKTLATHAESVQLLEDSAMCIIHTVVNLEISSQEKSPSEIPDPLSHALHKASLALQVLCLGFLSYSRGHAGKLQPFFLDHSVHDFILQGIHEEKQGEMHIRAKLVTLTCISDLLERPVLVFGLAAKYGPSNLADRFDLLASVEDVVDIWGPGLLKTTPSLLQNDRILCVKIGGGELRNSLEAPETLHWDTSLDVQADKHTDSQADGFSLHTKYVIGTLEVNPECPLRQHTTQERFLQASAHRLNILNTRTSAWRISTKSVQATAGQYVTLAAGVQFARIDGVTAKDLVLKAFEGSVCGWPLVWLNAYYGLQVSLCTRLARRVPLRVLLADVLPAYVASHVSGNTYWADYQDKLLEALRTGKFNDLSMDPQIKTHHDEIQKLFHNVLSNMRNTGVDRDGLFRIAVPRRNERCFKLECIQTNFWARILEDTDEDCATFAYVTMQCLQTDRIRCRGHDLDGWQDKSELLLTEVCLKSASTSGNADAAELNHGVEYRIGALTSGLVAFVDREESGAQPTLLISYGKSLEIPEKFRKRVGWQLKQRLRERGAFGGHTFEVAVRAKGTFGHASITSSTSAGLSASMRAIDRRTVRYKAAVVANRHNPDAAASSSPVLGGSSSACREG